MKKLFTLLAFLSCFLGANAKEFVDAEVDFSKYTDISEVSLPVGEVVNRQEHVSLFRMVAFTFIARKLPILLGIVSSSLSVV
jgi:hypothetical protein